MLLKERVAQGLRKAVEVMNDVGAHWTKGELRKIEDGEEQFCSLGAIYYITDLDLDEILRAEEDDEDGRARDLVREVGDAELRVALIQELSAEIREVEPTFARYASGDPLDDRMAWITCWNDNGERDWNDIVAMFERAALRVEEKGLSEEISD